MQLEQTVGRASRSETLHTIRRARTPEVGRAQVGALAVVAHDLRGPLANLRLLIEGIESEIGWEPTAAQHRIAARTRKAGLLIDRLDGLLQGVLQRVSRDGDPLSVSAETVDLTTLVEQTAALNAPAAERRKVRLHCLLMDPVGMSGDARLLGQAIDNLLANAIRHTPVGGLVLCELGLVDGEAVLRIADQGPGLTEQDLRRMFRPFTRLSAVADDGAPSHGVGLYLVRLIAERHGGRIEAGNRERGPGAVFTLRLPLAGTSTHEDRHAA